MKDGCIGCKNHKDKIGILIGQLGTPEAPSKEALRPYLKDFLGDPRIIEKPRWLWWLILRLFILPLRPARSAKLYARIWREDGSPLQVYTERQTEKLAEALKNTHESIEVTYGMRYSKPSLEDGIDELISRGCSKILLFNMYPQYSATTSASNYDAVFRHLLKRRVVPTLRVAEPYFNHPAYIRALAETINKGIKELPYTPERLVFSYHGIPEEYVEKGDTYCCHCTETTLALAPHLDLPTEKIIHTYQSRFGRDPWLVPYTDETIDQLAQESVKNIAVACPGFPADCLETLDEIGNEAEESFHENGGEQLRLIPGLNDQAPWIAAMKEIVEDEISSWLKTAERTSAGNCKVACPMKVHKNKQAKSGKAQNSKPVVVNAP